ncbi:hypothetical protein ACMXYX_17935 (plasmid) [Neptuniibacter sp. QD72_48]|uniref:hypothetical protein n=1 Tax=Neptuniibacter sp. QD72_48 TaxID=3398214 RepID=UPI0039F57D34
MVAKKKTEKTEQKEQGSSLLGSVVKLNSKKDDVEPHPEKEAAKAIIREDIPEADTKQETTETSEATQPAAEPEVKTEPETVETEETNEKEDEGTSFHVRISKSRLKKLRLMAMMDDLNLSDFVNDRFDQMEDGTCTSADIKARKKKREAAKK